MTTKTPELHKLGKEELHILFSVLRDPTTAYVYQVVAMHSDYETGEFLGSYTRLVEHATPPKPERGRSLPGPSLEQVKRAVRDLVAVGLLSRDTGKNTVLGQLRLQVVKMMAPAAPSAEDIQALRTDAERYRWLRNKSLGDDQTGCTSPYVVRGQTMDTVDGSALDAAVDFARG